MTFFYDLNKRLADLAAKQDAKQLTESAVVAEKADYSAKKAAAGKDIGKPGKMFSKIAKSAGKEYGSKAAGERVAGAVLNKLRAKESVEKSKMDESALQAYIGDKKYGKAGMDALRKAGRDGASKDKMSQIRNRYNKMDEADMSGSNVEILDQENEMDSMMFTLNVDGKNMPFVFQEYDEDFENAHIDDVYTQVKQQLSRLSKEQQKSVAQAVHKALAGSMEEGNEFSGELVRARAQGAKEFNVDGKSYPVRETEMTPKQKSFAKLAPPANKITFADKIAGAKKEVDEMLGDVAAEAIKGAIGKKKEPRSKGTAFDPEVSKTMTATDKHPRYDVKDTGYSTRYTRKVQDEPADDAEVSTEPKKKGRPKGPEKGPERVTKGSYKFKSGRPAKVAEDDVETTDRGEYDREGDMAKEQMHTIMSAAKELHGMLRDEENLPEWVQKKITLAMNYIDTARDYMLTQHAERAEEEPIAEKAVSKKQQRFMGMAHAMQKGEPIKGAGSELKKVAKTMKKGDVEDFAKTKHKGLPEKVKAKKTEGAKPDFLDVDKDGNKKESMKKAAGEKNEKKVEETSTESTPSKGGYNFGGGVYESLDRKFQQALTEGMNVSVNMSTGQDGEPTKNITISADGEDADKLAELLKMAGLDSQESACGTCGSTPCGCESLDENSPDWPTNTETSDNAMQYSGGLNGPKSTGQTTVPVVASQLRRQVSMEEGVKIEQSLFKLYNQYKIK
jgi:hypothetical protein